MREGRALRILVCAAGRGAGETWTAGRVVAGLIRAGHRVDVVTDRPRNVELLAASGVRPRLVHWSTDWVPAVVAHDRFDAVVASSSLTCRAHLASLAREIRGPLVSVEPSWLPWYTPEEHDVIDEFVLQYPADLLRAGMRGHGGSFVLDPRVAERVRAPGWFQPFAPMEEAERLAVRRRHEVSGRLVVMYGSRADGLETVAASLRDGVRLLAEALGDDALTVLLPGSRPEGRWEEPIRAMGRLPPAEFRRLCAAADVVVGAGLGATTTQALRAGVPCIVWSLPLHGEHDPWSWGDQEAHAAWNAGLVQRLTGHAPPSAVAAVLRAALTDPVLRREQRRAASAAADGVAYVVRRLEELVAAWPASVERREAALRRAVAASGRLEWDTACSEAEDAVGSAVRDGTGALAARVLVEASRARARALRRRGETMGAMAELARAVRAAASAVPLVRAPLGGDLLAAAVNELRAESHARAIHDLARFLLDNDEPIKALRLLDAVPHLLADHPLIVGIDLSLDPVRAHIHDPVAYRAYYEDEQATGGIPSDPGWLDPATCIPRARWAVERVRHHGARSVIDVGANDGIVAVPVLRACPGVHYVAVEPNVRARARLHDHLRTFEVTAQVVDDTAGLSQAEAVLCFEVIEHVPEPVALARELRRLCAARGHVLLTTPWGSVDAGHPPAANAHGSPRDPRAHLRAMTARDVVSTLDEAGLEPIGLHRVGRAGRFEAMHVEAAPCGPLEGLAVRFVAPGAREWNASVVRSGGAGVTAESIVAVAEALREEPSVGRVEVFAPVPDPEVVRMVRYWPIEQTRHLRHDPAPGPIVVCGPPGTVRGLRSVVGSRAPIVLWAHDARPSELLGAQPVCDRVVAVSHWQRDRLAHRAGLPRDAFPVIESPLVPEHFAGDVVPRDPLRIAFASHPRHGLARLLRSWRRVVERWPDATLHVFCEWGGDKTITHLANQPGVVVHGRVDPGTLARELRACSVWACPTDVEAPSCIHASTARAAGCVPVASRLGALIETVCAPGVLLDPPAEGGDGERFEDDFLHGIARGFEVNEQTRAEMRHATLERNDPRRAARAWAALLAELGPSDRSLAPEER